MRLKKKQKNIIGNLFQAANRLQSIGNNVSREISFKQWLALITLFNDSHKPLSLNDIASKLCVSRQSVRKMIDILERKGYVTITDSDVDNRAYLITYTERSEKEFDKYKEDIFETLDKIFADINEKEMDIFEDIIKKILRNMENEFK